MSSSIVFVFDITSIYYKRMNDFVRADNRNLPKIDLYMITSYMSRNKDWKIVRTTHSSLLSSYFWLKRGDEIKSESKFKHVIKYGDG